MPRRQVWTLLCFLVCPEDQILGMRTHEVPAVAGQAKAALWACLAVLAGLALGRLSG